MNLGWKVITGTIMLAVAQLFSAAMTDCPIPAWIPWLKWLSGLCNAGGMVLAGVGISSKFATATNSVTNTLMHNQQITTKALSEQKVMERVVVEKQVPYVVKRLGPDDDIIIRRSLKKPLNSGV